MSWHCSQGGGGGILASRLLGFHTVGAVEIEPSAREMLLARQRDGVLPRFPIWDDVQSFDGRPWRGLVDVISGGFPCQDISCAGKGAGIEGSRSGLWREMFRIIREVRPRYAFVENSPMLVSRGLSVVLGDLAEIGYHAAWCVLGAADVGAPHKRDRIWILAEDSRRRDVLSHSNMRRAGRRQQFQEGSPQEIRISPLDSDTYGMQCPEQRCEHERTEIPAGSGANRVESRGDVAHAHRARCAQTPPKRPDSKTGRAEPCGFGHATHPHLSGCEQQWRTQPDEAQHAAAECGGWWSSEPRVGRVADGVAHRVDRLRALGNGQVPLVAAVAFKVLRKRLIGG